jgi:hypothetical protein
MEATVRLRETALPGWQNTGIQTIQSDLHGNRVCYHNQRARRIQRYLIAKTKATHAAKSESNRPSKADSVSFFGFYRPISADGYA